MRLADGDEGRVEICIDDEWVVICGYEWLNGTWGREVLVLQRACVPLGRKIGGKREGM